MTRFRRVARAWLSPLSIAAAVGMFVVLVMGATVTTTGSAEGCGRDWPLCNGRFIPDFAVATAIEFSHRAVTGIEGILVVLVVAGVLLLRRDDARLRVLAPLMLLFLLLQAGMGAWAVKYPQQPVVLALHFGISLVAVASTTLTAFLVLAGNRVPMTAIASRAIRPLAVANAAYLYVLVYSGAYVRHVGAAVYCASWPLCGVSASPGDQAANLLHRLMAGGALALALGLWWLLRRERRADLDRAGAALVISLLAQGAAGAYLALSGFGLFGELVHAGVTAVVFTVAALILLLIAPPPSAALESLSERGPLPAPP